MCNYILSAESTVDLPFKRMQEKGVSIIFYTYSIGTTVFEDDMSRTIGERADFYRKLKAGAKPVTSQINTATYVDYFSAILDKKKKDVLHIAFGSGMSGSVFNAIEAAKEVNETHENKVVVLDSFCSSSGYGMLVEYAVDLRNAGKSFEEVEDWVKNNAKRIHHRFFCTDLAFFRRSGRVKAITSLIGTFLGICPLMKLDESGRIIAFGKIRGKRKAIDAVIDFMAENAEKGVDYDGKCFVNHSNCLETALIVKEKIEQRFPGLKDKIEIFDIGAVVSSHCGPDVTAVYFLGSKRD